MTLADLARHLDAAARIITVTAKFLTDLDKEIER